MDIKAKIEELVAKITKDASLKDLFQKNPVEAVEKTLGVDLPDEQIKAIVAGVEAALTSGQVSEQINGAVDKLKGFFGKK